jgi:hypothetical protein
MAEIRVYDFTGRPMRVIETRPTPRATAMAANVLSDRVLWVPVLGSVLVLTAAGSGVTVEPSTLGFRGTVVVGATGCGAAVGVVVGFVTAVGRGGVGVVAGLVVTGLVVAGLVVAVVVSTTPPQLVGRLGVMARVTEPPPGTANVMVTVKDASDIGSPVAVPSMFPFSKVPITLPTVMFDNVTPFETVRPVMVDGPG